MEKLPGCGRELTEELVERVLHGILNVPVQLVDQPVDVVSPVRDLLLWCVQ